MKELPFLKQYPTLRAQSRSEMFDNELWYSRLEKFECSDPDNVTVDCNSVVIDQLGVAVTTSTGFRSWKNDPDCFSIFVMLDGEVSMEANSRSVDLRPGHTLLVSPGRRVTSPKDGSMAAYLSIPARPIIYERAKPLPPLLLKESGSIARMTMTLLHELSHRQTPPSARVAGAWAALIGAQILETLHDAEILEPQHAASFRLVRQAEDYIIARLEQVLTIDAIASKMSISSRALQLAFRKHRGMSPHEFIARERLAKVRMRLLQARGDETVTSIALGTGVTSLGRFAARYRALYGESPSETLARAERKH